METMTETAWYRGLNAKLGTSALAMLVLALALVVGNLAMLGDIAGDTATLNLIAKGRYIRALVGFSANVAAA